METRKLIGNSDWNSADKAGLFLEPTAHPILISPSQSSQNPLNMSQSTEAVREQMEETTLVLQLAQKITKIPG
jgi:hypothetical protein